VSKPYHHGSLAAALVDEAAALVEATGPAAVNLRDVARRVGVSPPAIYRHFANKEALLAAVAARGFARLVAAVETAQAPDATPIARLHALCRAYVDYAAAHPHLHALMFGPRGTATASVLDQVSERSFRLLVDAVTACLSPETPSERVLAAAIAVWSQVHGYATLRRDGQLAGFPATALPDTERIMAGMVLSM